VYLTKVSPLHRQYPERLGPHTAYSRSDENCT
jgi:hypothetical protein